MKKLMIYFDPHGNGTETKYLGSLTQEGVYEGDERLERDIERILKFNNYDLFDKDDWLELQMKLSDTMTFAKEVDI